MRATAHFILRSYAGFGPAGRAAVGWVALKMLTGDRAKYFALVFGIERTVGLQEYTRL